MKNGTPSPAPGEEFLGYFSPLMFDLLTWEGKRWGTEESVRGGKPYFAVYITAGQRPKKATNGSTQKPKQSTLKPKKGKLIKKVEKASIRREIEVRHAEVIRQTDTRPDTKLIELSREGDESAFAALHYRYCGRAISIAVNKLGDGALAQDACQNAWVKCWRNGFRGFDPAAGSFEAWLAQVVRFSAIDVYRRQTSATQRASPLEVLQEEEGTELASTDLSTSEKVEAAELAQNVLEAIGQIPLSHHREAITLYLRGIPATQIHQLMGTSTVAITKSHLVFAKKRLRRLIDRYGEFRTYRPWSNGRVWSVDNGVRTTVAEEVDIWSQGTQHC